MNGEALQSLSSRDSEAERRLQMSATRDFLMTSKAL